MNNSSRIILITLVRTFKNQLELCLKNLFKAIKCLNLTNCTLTISSLNFLMVGYKVLKVNWKNMFLIESLQLCIDNKVEPSLLFKDQIPKEEWLQYTKSIFLILIKKFKTFLRKKCILWCLKRHHYSTIKSLRIWKWTSISLENKALFFTTMHWMKTISLSLTNINLLLIQKIHKWLFLNLSFREVIKVVKHFLDKINL